MKIIASSCVLNRVVTKSFHDHVMYTSLKRFKTELYFDQIWLFTYSLNKRLAFSHEFTEIHFSTRQDIY